MDAKRARELLPVSETRAELPPILAGRVTPVVGAQVGNFYGSVAEIFERWVTRRSSTHTRRAYCQDVMDFVQFLGPRWPEESTRLFTVSIAEVQAFRDQISPRAPSRLARIGGGTMSRLVKRIAPVLFALATLSPVGLASGPPSEVGDRVEIVILVGPSETAEAARAIGLLSDALRAGSLTVVRKPADDPRGYLDHHPKASHVVAGILCDEGKLMAWVYTRGVESPRAIRAPSADDLKGAIVAYIEGTELDRGWEFVYLAERPGRAAAESAADYRRAVVAFDRALAINPRSAMAHYQLAYCYKRIGDRASYRDHVAGGLKCAPESPALRNEEALLAIADGKSDEGIAILRGLPQDRPLYQLNLAWAYAQTNRPELAQGILKGLRMQDADPSLVEVAERRLRELEAKEKELRVVGAKLNWRTLALWAVAGVASAGIAASGGYYLRILEEYPRGSQREIKRTTTVTILGALCSLMTALCGLLLK